MTCLQFKLSLIISNSPLWAVFISAKSHTLRKSLQTTSALSATSKRYFEQPAASFLVCSLIFIEYQIPPATQQVSLNPGQTFQYLT